MRFPVSVSGAAIALALLAAPAAAAPFGGALSGNVAAPTALGEDSLAVQVQYRRGPRGGHRGGGGRGDDGASVAAGILGGLLLGAIIANEAQRSNRSVEYCVRRFRSYDPQSGTYLGNDGYRHRCP